MGKSMDTIRKMWKAIVTAGGFDHNWYRGLAIGVAPEISHLRVLRLIQPGFVVDIGANRGQFALAVRHVCRDAHIVSFEPLPGPAKKFLAIFGGDPLVRLYQSAIGPERGVAKIHISMRDDSSSLLPISKKQEEIFPGTGEVDIRSASVGRLDDFIAAEEVQPSSLLKLDVQGFELLALRGCENLLSNFSWIYVECSFMELYEGQAMADTVVAWLRDRYFGLAGVYNMTYSHGRAIQADFLFSSYKNK